MASRGGYGGGYGGDRGGRGRGGGYGGDRGGRGYGGDRGGRGYGGDRGGRGYGGDRGGRGYGGDRGGRGYGGDRGGGGGGGGGRGRGGGRGAPPLEQLTPETWVVAATARAGEQLSLTAHPSSSKAIGPPPRPGYGTIGKPCFVRANHFLVKLAVNDLYHYDVSIIPADKSKNVSNEITSKKLCKDIMSTLVQSYKETCLGNRMPAFDGKKSIYTAGQLPFVSKDFVVALPERDSAGSSRSSNREEQRFKVTIKFAAQIDVHHLHEFLNGRQKEAPQVAIQALDVALRAAKSTNDVVSIGRSFFSTSLGKFGGDGDGIEFWRGYYQSLRPTQMGLSLNIDSTAQPFLKPVMVDEFVAQYLNLRQLSRPLSDNDRLKIKRCLKGYTVETTHLGYCRRFKICGVTRNPASKEMFAMDVDGREIQMSVVEYFRQKYHIEIQRPFLPALQYGSEKRLKSIPMELCKICDGQKYSRKLNEKQVTTLLRATCQRPHEREGYIRQMVKDNRYEQNLLLQEFGIRVAEEVASIKARVLPVPVLKYHESGESPMTTPGVGQWNMINKKMYNGGSVSSWTCLNFSSMPQNKASQFCAELVSMCRSKGMDFAQTPVIPVRTVPRSDIERALVDVHSRARQQIQLLIIILPDDTGHYGKIKRICETELGIISQCCKPGNASRPNNMQYLENVALKINVKAGGRNVVLNDAILRKIPTLTDCPTIIFGADVTHPAPGEDSVPSIAAVVASMDWPEVTKYRGLVSAQVSAQGRREEIIKDLYKLVQDPQKGAVHSGIIRELLIAFKKSTNMKPKRIIFYRDGVGEGQFSQVLLEEMDAIRKACSSLEENYMPPVTFVVVQKRHHTKLFPVDRNMTDRSGNILPGTVVDTQICHPTEFDFYLCSHAGIQGVSRPTHYHVLFDENGFTPDLLQLLTNSLCYTYARCTRSVSIVPPAYYAHLLAFRARYYIEVAEGGSSGGRMTAEGTREAKPLPRIKDSVKDVMFYC